MRTCEEWKSHWGLSFLHRSTHAEHLQVAGAVQDAKNTQVKNTTSGPTGSAGLRNRPEAVFFLPVPSDSGWEKNNKAKSAACLAEKEVTDF